MKNIVIIEKEDNIDLDNILSNYLIFKASTKDDVNVLSRTWDLDVLIAPRDIHIENPNGLLFLYQNQSEINNIIKKIKFLNN